ncbi:MAG: PhnD/SsuA/transferrin family substrate-binding protein [Gemmataceae bacterium]
MTTVAAAGCLALLIAVSLPGPTSGANNNLSSLRIGLVDTLGQGIPRALVFNVLSPFKSLMEEQTGLTSEIVSGGDAVGLAAKLRDDKVQLAVFHGHEFAWAKLADPKVRAMALCVNRGPTMRAVLVVRKDSRHTTTADLRGKTVNLAKLNRAHCRLFLERRCVRPGMTPAAFFGRLNTPLDIFDSLDGVVAGRAAAAVVDATSLEDYARTSPGRARSLRVLTESEPFPCGVLACYEGKLPAGEIKRIQEGLLSAGDSARGKEVLKALRITGFELPPDDHDAALTAIAKAYPPVEK